MTAVSSPVSTRRRTRRNRITPVDSIAILGAAAGGALLGALADVAPTAWAPANRILAAALVAVVAWCGASAPWWVLAAAGAMATLTATDPIPAALAGVGFVLALAVGGVMASWPVARAIAAALIINALLRWDPGGFYGLSAIVTGAVAVIIVVTGLSRRGRYARSTAGRAAVIVVAITGVVVAAAALAAWSAAGPLRDGERALRDAASALQRGDFQQAADQLATSEKFMTEASDALDRPWARPALAVPVVGQHLAAAREIAAGAHDLAAVAARSVTQVNLDSLKVQQGVIDLNAIEVLQHPLEQTDDALGRMLATTRRAVGPWLVAPAAHAIEDLATELDDLRQQTDNALAAARIAPQLLGRDGPRTYFVAFTTPAEARGLGGFMSSFAELHVDHGRLDVTRTGGTVELAGTGRHLNAPADYLRRYGRFGAGADGQPVAVDFWSNITMAPDLPSVAQVISQLYPQSGGREIDGVIVMDVVAAARFLRVTGPVQLPTLGLTLDATNATEFLLSGQYAAPYAGLSNTIAAEATAALLEKVFGGDLPGPRVLAETLGPSMAEGRVAMWSSRQDEEAALEALGIAGSLPSPVPDGLAVVSNNAGPNKLDSYLRRSITYEGTVDRQTGTVRTTATIRLTNTAPPTGLTEDAAGNAGGLPLATNRMYLSVYSPWDLTGAERDGSPVPLEPDRELSWHSYSTYVDIPPGGEVTFRLAFIGTIAKGTAVGDYGLLLRSQALSVPDVVRVDVRESDGTPLVESQRTRMGVQVLRGTT